MHQELSDAYEAERQDWIKTGFNSGTGEKTPTIKRLLITGLSSSGEEPFSSFQFNSAVVVPDCEAVNIIHICVEILPIQYLFDIITEDMHMRTKVVIIMADSYKKFWKKLLNREKRIYSSLQVLILHSQRDQEEMRMFKLSHWLKYMCRWDARLVTLLKSSPRKIWEVDE